MTDSMQQYKKWIAENKPDEITQDTYGFWQHNGHKFPTYLQAKWYRDSILKHKRQTT